MKIKLGIIGFGGMGKWHAENALVLALKLQQYVTSKKKTAGCT